MGRHVAIDDLAAVGATRRPRWGLRMLAVVGLLVLAVALAGILVVGPRRAYALLPLTTTTSCTPVDVDVSAAPAAVPVVRQAVAAIQGQDVGAGQCVRVVVSAQDPAGTVAGSAVLPPDRAPDVWIPDSSLWISLNANRVWSSTAEWT